IPHHVSYDPEVIQTICRSCHGKAHASENAPKKPEGFRYPPSPQVKITIDASTRDDLRALKKGGETFDNVLRRLIKTEVVAKLELGDLLQELLDIEEEG
ncbi:unnamed protein product, partial [marine sediment metagenome]